MTVEAWRPGPRSEIAGWVDDFKELATIAGQLAQTNFIPQSLRVYRDQARRDEDVAATAAQVVVAILTGEEVGLPRVAALRSVDVINGTPALRAVALRALVLAAGHEIRVEEQTNSRATVAGRRAGTDYWQRVTWTMDDARSRNLQNKPNWRAQPRNMLVARATGDIARLVAPDALLGLAYTVEELQDGDTDVQPVEVPPAPPAAPRKARRLPRKVEVTAAPVGDDEPTPDDRPAMSDAASSGMSRDGHVDEPPLDAPGPPLVTPAQLRKLHASLSEQNILDREDRLAYVQDIIGREIGSSQELTVAEASAVINELQSLDLPPGEGDEPDA